MRLNSLTSTLCASLLSMACLAQNFGGNANSLHWMQLNSPQSRVIFPKGLDSQANRVANIIQLLDSTTLYSIGTNVRKWNVVLQNQTTLSNAYVRLAPVMSELYLKPGQDNFSNGSLRADDNLIIHEDRHMQQFSNFNKGLTKIFSFFLGQQGQLLANGMAIPDYFFEGDAVWQETLVSAQGRGRIPWFFNGMKSLTLENRQLSWMKLRSGSLRQYTPDHYELGYQIVAYGYHQYGEDFWRKVTEDAVKFKGLFYAFNNAIEKWSGKSYQQFREDAMQYFREQTLSESRTTDPFDYITPVEKNNVTDFLFPAFVNNDTLVVTKKSYRELNSFYLIIKGKEERIRLKDYVLDDYFSYSNGKLVYAAYQSDPRWGNRDYSVIKVLDIYTKKQQQISFKSKYFSPDIRADGKEVLVVNMINDGSNFLNRLDATNGTLIRVIPNPNNYLFTQTKYIDSNEAVSAVRNAQGEMALVKVNLISGATELLSEFSYNVLGFPQVAGGWVYFTMTDNFYNGTGNKAADRIFALDLQSKKIVRITHNINGIYHPAVSKAGVLVFSAFSSNGSRLVKMENVSTHFDSSLDTKKISERAIPANDGLQKKGAGILYQLSEKKNVITAYPKSFQLFNFHSARPIAADPEYGYTFYSDNILSTFSNSIYYKYNRNELSHTVGYNAVFSQWFPYLNLGAEYRVNRNVYNNQGKLIQLNSAKLNPGISVPLSFIGGRTFKFLNVGVGYNIEQDMFTGQSHSIYKDQTLQYGNSFLSFTNQSRLPVQAINPAWAQTVSVYYNDAFSLVKSHKLVGIASLYFPGLIVNHSLVLDGAAQFRDTLADLFTNIFPYSRGYQGLSETQMYKWGINYHFPLCYPDWGFGNIIFFQRVRANAFYDDTHVKALSTSHRYFEFNNRSTGVEIYFDTKVWNELPLNFGFRYSRLLDKDFLNPGAVNRWEFILPINLVPSGVSHQ